MTLTPKNWKEFQHYSDRKPAWVKLHKTLLDDFKFARLPVASRALAPMLWLLASEYSDGEITASMDEISFRLHMTGDDLKESLKPLIDCGFFIASEPLSDGYQDACLEREIQEQIQEEKESCAVATATRTPDRFEDFWKAYPKREGASGKAQARKKFLGLVKSGLDPGALIVAAAKYAEEARKSGQFGTPYVAMARTWLNQQRYDDYRSPPADTGPPKPPHADLPSHEELLEKYGKSDRPTATETIVRSEPDHTGKLRQNGTETCSGVGCDGVSGVDARKSGMRGLGEVFRPPLRGQAVGLQGADERENPGHDGSDPVARMV